MDEFYVLAALYAEDRVLLVRRAAQEFGKGKYSLIGGKVEPRERALHAIRREVQEETGLDIPESDFTLVHTLHRLGTEGPFIALCFKADIAQLNPHNTEPEKHDDMRFFSVHDLPENLLPAHKQIVEQSICHRPYSEHGW
jgi:8-oxo-dGTP pyrophosphatase MutT (NUDIX family)